MDKALEAVARELCRVDLMQTLDEDHSPDPSVVETNWYTNADIYIQQAEAAIAAYEAAMWRPIEEAPKDGTPVLVATHDSTFGWVRGWARYEDLGGRIGGGWVSYGFFEPPGNLGLGSPTHFRPLPDMDKASIDGERG